MSQIEAELTAFTFLGFPEEGHSRLKENSIYFTEVMWATAS
jgi:hypothetical protein